MRIVAAAFAILALIAGCATPANAQDALDESTLVRAVARLWTAPLVFTETVTMAEVVDGTPVNETTTTRTLNADGTPIASPQATAEAPGAVLLVVAVFQFDTAEHAEAGFAIMMTDVAETAASDPSFAGAAAGSLGIGGNSSAVFAAGEMDGVPLSFGYAMVQDGAFVYQVQGQFARLEAREEISLIVATLMAAEPGPGAETFDRDGGSTGGIWDKLAPVSPTIVPGTTVADARIFPAPSPNVVRPAPGSGSG